MKVLRTPEEHFENLKGFPFEPHYLEIDDGESGRLSQAWCRSFPMTRRFPTIAAPGSSCSVACRSSPGCKSGLSVSLLG